MQNLLQAMRLKLSHTCVACNVIFSLSAIVISGVKRTIRFAYVMHGYPCNTDVGQSFKYVYYSYIYTYILAAVHHCWSLYVYIIILDGTQSFKAKAPKLKFWTL